MNKGRVLQVLSDRFVVDTGDEPVFVKARKRVKRESLPLPGDIVMLERVGDEAVLSRIEPRKSRIVRPPIANPDQIIITLAPLPEADLLTVDKMLLNAHKAGIRTVVCLNKTDILPEGMWENIHAQYKGVADDVLAVCAAKGNVEELREVLRGRFSCFAGQSAVGKTSLVNAICGVAREVGNLSEKTLRGKNTTTGVELIKIGDDTYVADTPGFGALDLMDIEAAELPLYYDEYLRLAENCKYHMCTHISEPYCAVKAAVESGVLNRARYERYCRLSEELKKQKMHRKSWRTTYESK